MRQTPYGLLTILLVAGMTGAVAAPVDGLPPGPVQGHAPEAPPSPCTVYVYPTGPYVAVNCRSQALAADVQVRHGFDPNSGPCASAGLAARDPLVAGCGEDAHAAGAHLLP